MKNSAGCMIFVKKEGNRDQAPPQPRSQGSLLPALRSEREREPWERGNEVGSSPPFPDPGTCDPHTKLSSTRVPQLEK